MGLPKRRHSRARGRRRRTQYRIGMLARSLCSRCQRPKVPHRVCPHCGYYAGREVLLVEPS
ncbi:MAG: 50S ribosomal protein L32 [Nitrospinota bacterium]